MADLLRNLRPAQARLVAAIATHGQLQVAASECGLTQPAASRLLADLERQLETRLFTRTPKGMEPTPSGTLMARHAARMVFGLGQLTEEFADLQTGKGGLVRVGAVTGPALGQLVPAIQRLKQQAPMVNISVEVAPSLVLVQALERGDLDFALARLPPHVDQRDFDVEPARNEIVQLLVRDEHPMLGQGPVSMGSLHDLPWILQDRGAPIRQAIEAAFHDERLVAPHDVITTSSLLVIIALLKESNAIAPMSTEVIDLMLEPPVSAGFRRLELKRQIVVDPYLIIRSRGRSLSRAAETLLSFTRERIATG